jgi:hypothetical protein
MGVVNVRMSCIYYILKKVTNKFHMIDLIHTLHVILENLNSILQIHMLNITYTCLLRNFIPLLKF